MHKTKRIKERRVTPLNTDCSCGFCVPLRMLQRRLRDERRALGNENAHLFELVDANPPEGGMQAFIDYLNGKRG
jgi:hypothetical protein